MNLQPTWYIVATSYLYKVESTKIRIKKQVNGTQISNIALFTWEDVETCEWSHKCNHEQTLPNKSREVFKMVTLFIQSYYGKKDYPSQ